MKKQIFLFLTSGIILLSCNRNLNKADAYGNFEADELTVSSETSGKIIDFKATEGIRMKAGETVAVIDTTQLYLKKKQMEATINAVREKLPDEAVQIAVFDERLKKLRREETRIGKLVKNNAAPQKLLDDIQAETEVTLKQKKASESALTTQSRGLLAEIEPLRFQLMQIDDQLRKCYVINPVSGTVLNTFTKKSELVQTGKPLYKIASLDTIILRAYITEVQLSQIKTGSTVKVKTDAADKELKTFQGTVSWISSEAEFTPKIIQTREERVNQVYAVKILVPNTGELKIGMPGEVYFK